MRRTAGTSPTLRPFHSDLPLFAVTTSWWVFALLSALFAALTAIFAKIGMRGVDSDLVTALRTVVVLLLTWGIVLVRGAEQAAPAHGPQLDVFGLVGPGDGRLLAVLFPGPATGAGESGRARR